jgi:multiple sugar transport system permease protein
MQAKSEVSLTERRRGKAFIGARRKSGRVFLYLLALALSFLFMMPFIWSLSTSLKDYNEVFRFPPTLFPKEVKWSNYPIAWQLQPVGQWMWNSTMVTFLSLVGVVLSASLVAYSFAKFRYHGQALLFTLTLSTMMLPASVTLIPQYLVFHQLHWLNSFKPLIIPAYFGGGAFNIFLLRQFFLTIPNDLSDAAKIDGANSLRILFSVILPLSKPALATVSVIYVLWCWNDFMGPLIYLNSAEKFTMAIGIKYFERSGQGASFSVSGGLPIEHLLMAVSVTMTAPIVLLFFLTQKYFVQGVVMSGIKG